MINWLVRYGYGPSLILGGVIGGLVAQLSGMSTGPAVGAVWGCALALLALWGLAVIVRERLIARAGHRMPECFEALAVCNGECSRGITHTPEYDAEMAGLQRDYYTWAEIFHG